MKGRIALIIPYFGTLPRWFPYFVESLSASPILDLHLFTDALVPKLDCGNLTVHRFSIGEFCALASRQLSVSVNMARPYKLCDFKPAFGHIFADYLNGYEFWAFGDIDLVYGDVTGFLSPLLPSYDVISCRKGWVSGSLFILRNREDVNRLYMRSSDWSRILTSSENMRFCELGGFLFTQVLHGADALSLKSAVESFTHIVKSQAREGTLRCFFDDLACENIRWGQTLMYDHGKMTCGKEGSSVMYVHYVFMRRRFFSVPDIEIAPERFYIRNTGIYVNRPTAVTICTREASRVVLGVLRGIGRLVRRYTLPKSPITKA